MHHQIIRATAVAIALLLSASLACAVVKKVETPGATAASAKAGEESAKDKNPTAPAKSKAAAPVKLVNINSASKAELMKLPDVNDTLADKIIAGRPYYTKTHLVTKKIISIDVYDNLSKLITAKQK